MTALVGVVWASADTDVDTPIGGLPPVLRHVLSLQAAGLEEVVVVGASAPTDPRVTVAMGSVVPGDRPAVILPVDMTCHRALPTRAVQAFDDAEDRIVAYGAGTQAVFVAPAGRAPSILDALERGETEDATKGTLLSHEFVLPARTKADRRASLRRHLPSLIKPTGGWIDRTLMRRLSLPITRLLLPTPITPTQVTVLSIVLAFVAAYLVTLPMAWAPIAGGLLHIWVRIVDCIDGELARFRYQHSRFGQWLDSVGDVVGVAALVAAVTWRMASDSTWLWIGVAGVIGYLVGQVLQAWTTYAKTGGGAVQEVQWTFKSEEATGADRLAGMLHGFARIDFISTAYGTMIVFGAYPLLLTMHLIASSAGLVYFVAEIVRARGS